MAKKKQLESERTKQDYFLYTAKDMQFAVGV